VRLNGHNYAQTAANCCYEASGENSDESRRCSAMDAQLVPTRKENIKCLNVVGAMKVRSSGLGRLAEETNFSANHSRIFPTCRLHSIATDFTNGTRPLTILAHVLDFICRFPRFLSVRLQTGQKACILVSKHSPFQRAKDLRIGTAFGPTQASRMRENQRRDDELHRLLPSLYHLGLPSCLSSSRILPTASMDVPSSGVAPLGHRSVTPSW
jgi:hypothetical protein